MSRRALVPSTVLLSQPLQPTRGATEVLARLAPCLAAQQARHLLLLRARVRGLTIRHWSTVRHRLTIRHWSTVRHRLTVRHRRTRTQSWGTAWWCGVLRAWWEQPQWVGPGRRRGTLGCVYVEPAVVPIVIPTRSDLQKLKPKQTYKKSYSVTQPGGNARVSGFCGPFGAGVTAGPSVDVVVGVGDVGGGPRG